MAQESSVPKFGHWEIEENVPYTAYFEKARKGRTGGKMNRNESQASYFQMESKGAQRGEQNGRSKQEHYFSQEEIDLRRSADSPLHHDDAGHRDRAKIVLKAKHEHGGDGRQRRPTDSSTHHDIDGRRVAAHDSPLHRYGGVSSGDTNKNAMQRSAASDLTIEQSPVHPHNQGKFKGNSSSLSWEKKSSSEGSHGLAPMTPGRSRLRSVTRGDDTPDHNAAVPKFGDWDETNPASADGYTHIFNRVREERQGGAAKVPVLPTETSHSNGQKHCGNEKSKTWCCFPWGR